MNTNPSHSIQNFTNNCLSSSAPQRPFPIMAFAIAIITMSVAIFLLLRDVTIPSTGMNVISLNTETMGCILLPSSLLPLMYAAVEPDLKKAWQGCVSHIRWANMVDIEDYCRVLSKNGNWFFPCNSTNLLTTREYRVYLNQALEENSLFLMPLLYKEHWFLVIVDPVNKRIEYYDSLAQKPPSVTITACLQNIANAIYAYNKEKFQHIPPQVKENEFQATPVIENPHQTNNYDCGTCICYYMFHRTEGKSFEELKALLQTEASSIITAFRSTIYSEIGHPFSGRYNVISTLLPRFDYRIY